MKGLEKLTSVRLAEILSQKNVVATDAITDALYTQDEFGEAFVDALVDSGHINEWDLAKVVVEHFQLPFITASNYEISDEAKARIPGSALVDATIVPLDCYGPVGMTVAMPILAPFEVLDKIQREHGVDLFPHVGLITENKKMLQDLYPDDYATWLEGQEEKTRRRLKEKNSKEGRDWMNIFDTGDEAVRGT